MRLVITGLGCSWIPLSILNKPHATYKNGERINGRKTALCQFCEQGHPRGIEPAEVTSTARSPRSDSTKEAPDNYTKPRAIRSLASSPILQDGEAPEAERLVVQSAQPGARKPATSSRFSEDGYGLIPIKPTTTRSARSSKFDLFKCSLENEGVSSSIFEAGDWSKVLGTRALRTGSASTTRRLLGKVREFTGDPAQQEGVQKFPPQTLVAASSCWTRAPRRRSPHPRRPRRPQRSQPRRPTTAAPSR